MSTEQRRHFSRIPFHGNAHLLIGVDEWPCEVLDLSLKGALISIDTALPDSPPDERCLLELQLADGVVVRMEGDIVHREASHLGLACRDIDLDSITHLRRLLELNLGDAALLQREFSALVAG